MSIDTAAVARRMLGQGWSPLPLPVGKKWPPPKDYTGYAGRMATAADVDRWEANGAWGGNLALRLPPDVVGIDVDAYKGGDVAELEDRYGPLPATIWSTSRTDGSGIALFRVPSGTTLNANPTAAIEMIQAHHRYMVVWPSVHPDTGAVYEWLDESLEPLDGPPDIDDLPELPWTWIEGLAVAKGETATAAAPEEVRSFIETHAAGTAPGRLRGVESRLRDYQGSRHDTLVGVACWALREAAAGCYSATDAIAVLEAWWRRVMDDPNRVEHEFGAAIRWATAQATLDPARIDQIRAETKTSPAPPANIDPATGEVLEDRRSLPEQFWEARDFLAHVRQAAHARTRSADAVLLFVLARTAALLGPEVRLPAIVGGEGSMNFLGGVVSRSGGGKSSAGAVARELVPIKLKNVVADVPPGSGEGLAELYFEMVTEEGDDGKKRKVKRQTKQGAFIYLDEGQALAEMGNRKGATLLPTLRAAWSGEAIGQSNATTETHRVLKDHTYRMSIMVGFQLEYAAGLIDDAPGGTPQRFVFARAGDPSIPDVAPDWPGVLMERPPPSLPGGYVFGFDDDVAEEIRIADRDRQREVVIPDPLDAHADLVRMKVAALLAVLDRHRRHVERSDWKLAGEIMDTSRAVRSWVIEHARLEAARKEDAHREMQVSREAASERAAVRRAVVQGARSLARKVHKMHPETAARRDLLAATASRYKKVVGIDEMIDHALGEEWIRSVGDRFEVGRCSP